MKRDKAPTYQSRVETVLREADDFRTVAEITEVSGVDPQHVFSALWILHRTYTGAEFIKSNGRTYWFLTPETDTRLRTVDERKLEEPGSRGGKRRPKVLPLEGALSAAAADQGAGSPFATTSERIKAFNEGTTTQGEAGLDLNDE